jgi:two-component system chemotaxis response regulator CheB
VLAGSRENSVRPAIDPLFRLAAWAYDGRVVGVVLSGALDDGAAGLRAIKRRGGVTVVQDPRDALFAGMPESALELAPADYRLPADEIGALLTNLARGERDVQQERSVETAEMAAPCVVLETTGAQAQMSNTERRGGGSATSGDTPAMRLAPKAQEAAEHVETIRRTLLSLVQSLQMDPV